MLLNLRGLSLADNSNESGLQLVFALQGDSKKSNIKRTIYGQWHELLIIADYILMTNVWITGQNIDPRPYISGGSSTRSIFTREETYFQQLI